MYSPIELNSAPSRFAADFDWDRTPTNEQRWHLWGRCQNRMELEGADRLVQVSSSSYVPSESMIYLRGISVREGGKGAQHSG